MAAPVQGPPLVGQHAQPTSGGGPRLVGQHAQPSTRNGGGRQISHANQGKPAASAGPAASGGAAAGPAGAPGAPAPVTADPRDALYYDTLNRLNFALKNSLANFNQGEANAQAAYGYGTDQVNRALPLNLANTRNVANTQGLLESGIEGQRAGQVQEKSVQAQGRLTSTLQNTDARLAAAWQAAQGAQQQGATTAYDTALIRANKGDIAAGPNDATLPAASATVASPRPGAPARAGATPNGSVRAGTATIDTRLNARPQQQIATAPPQGKLAGRAQRQIGTAQGKNVRQAAAKRSINPYGV